MKFDKVFVLGDDDVVVCDLCDKDYSKSDDSGGFLFQSKAVCPTCAPDMLKRIEEFGEQHYIHEYCPSDSSFKDWVLSFRLY